MANFNFPNNVTQFNTYMTAFHKAFNAHYRTYGFSQSDVRVFNQFYKSWQQNYTLYTQYSAMNEFFTKFWSSEFSNFQTYFSWVFAQIQKNPSFNGNGHYWFGNTAVKSIPVVKSAAKKSTTKKTVAKKTTAKKAVVSKSTTSSSTSKTPVRSTTSVRASSPTRKTVSTKKSTTVRSTTSSNSTSSFLKSAPIVWFTSTKKGQVNVWVGNTKNGTFKLPEGASAVYVEYRYEGGAWTRLTQGAKFPFIHSLNSSKKVYYRACWVGSNNTKGVFSTTASWNNTAKAA